LGIGEKEKSHFYLTYMKIKDDTSKVVEGVEGNDPTFKPRSNDVLGAEFRLSFLEKKWTIDGEAGVAALTRDTRFGYSYDSIIESVTSEVPDFLIRLVNPNLSTSGDYAYAVKSELNLRTTKLSGGYSWVGPGYATLGNPLLINDRETFEGRIDQAFYLRRLSVSAYFKRFRDNLVGWKEGTTVSTAVGFIARLTLKNAPYFQVSYTPNFQRSHGGSQSIKNHQNIFSFSTGYRYPIAGLMSFTIINYFNQFANYKNEVMDQFSKTHTVSLNEILNFPTPNQLNFSASYTATRNTGFERNVVSIAMSGTNTFKKKWKNTLGGKYMISEGFYGGNKLSFNWDSMINFYRDWDFGLSISQNIFDNRGHAIDNFNELIVQCKLMLRW
jgi:hypothetical protein